MDAASTILDPASLQATLATGVTAGQADDPSQMSSERRAMQPDVDRIADILDGLDAVRRKGTVYLPKYGNEDASEYNRRLAEAPWRPEFDDALRALRSKPFGQPVVFRGEVDDTIAGVLDEETKQRSGGFGDDVDGRGNNLTTFAREWFGKGIAFGLHVILVDFPDMNPDDQAPDGSTTSAPATVRPRTIAEEKAIGARPYWVHVPVPRLLACYTQMVNGKETIVHLRFREVTTTRDGFAEKTLQRIRVLEPGKWELWEEQQVQVQGRASIHWVMIDSGTISRGPSAETSIPAVLFFTGERVGEMQVKPPLSQLAHMQIELYRALSREDEILNFAGSPMLKAKGMVAPKDGGSVVVGPRRILYAPPSEGGSDWDYIQPAAANLAEIRAKIGAIQEDMRRVGMQPLVQPSGNPTATGQSIDAAQAHSAVKAWALELNDAIEQAFVFTAQWLGLEETISTEVSTDFADAGADMSRYGLPALTAMRAAGDLSQGTYWRAFQRYDILPPGFDPEAEEQALAEEQQGLDPEEGIDPATGQPLGDISAADMAALFHPDVLAAAGGTQPAPGAPPAPGPARVPPAATPARVPPPRVPAPARP